MANTSLSAASVRSDLRTDDSSNGTRCVEHEEKNYKMAELAADAFSFLPAPVRPLIRG